MPDDVWRCQALKPDSIEAKPRRFEHILNVKYLAVQGVGRGITEASRRPNTALYTVYSARVEGPVA